MRYINTLTPAKLFSLVSATSSTSPLQDLPSPLPLLLLDILCPDVEAVPVSPCLCPLRGLKTLTRESTALPRLHLPNELLTFTHMSTQDVLQVHFRLSLASQLHFQDCARQTDSDFHSQVNSRRASKCTSDFHSQVKRTSKIVLLIITSQHECAIQVHTQDRATQVHGQVHLKASSLLTLSHSRQARHCGTSLFVVQYSRSCELDTATLPQVLCVERRLWAGFARGAVSHSRPAQRSTPGTLPLYYLGCVASVLLNEARPCHLPPYIVFYFDFAIPTRPLSSLTPSLQNKNKQPIFMCFVICSCGTSPSNMFGVFRGVP